VRVLVACEFSGRVRDAFIAKGHDAISCDLLPTDAPGPHYQGDVFDIINDVFDIINDGFDLMIAHPPCTHLCVSGARWFKDKQEEQKEAIEFFMALANADIPKIAIENPIGIMSTHYRKPIRAGPMQWQINGAKNESANNEIKIQPYLVRQATW